MSRKFLLSPMRGRLLAALVAPLLCAGAAPQIEQEQVCKHPSRPAAGGACTPRRQATARKPAAEPPAQRPAPGASVRPGPNHKAWFDDYGVKGAGLIER